MSVAKFLTTKTCDEPRDLDVRKGTASMEWYRAMSARRRGDMTAVDVDLEEAGLSERSARDTPGKRLETNGPDPGCGKEPGRLG